MATNNLALRLFVGLAYVSSVALGAVIGLFVGPSDDPIEMVGSSAVGALLGLFASGMVHGIVYLVLVAKDVATLEIPEEELAEGEIVVRAHPGSMVHYRSGRPWRFWEAVGGRLFLTTRALEFRAHRGQPWVYRLTIPLEKIRAATPCKLFGLIPGALRIETIDDDFELFTFGAAVDSYRAARDGDSAGDSAGGDSAGWAATILAVRDADLPVPPGPALRTAPPMIGGARVICFAPIDVHRHPRKSVQIAAGVAPAPAAGLAICQYEGEAGYFLFGCDAAWDSITDTWHATLDEAKRQAEREYAGVTARWQTPA